MPHKPTYVFAWNKYFCMIPVTAATVVQQWLTYYVFYIGCKKHNVPYRAVKHEGIKLYNLLKSSAYHER